MNISITLPERKIDLARKDNKDLLNYLFKQSNISSMISYNKIINKEGFRVNLVVDLKSVGAHVPISVIKRNGYFHFSSTIMALSDTPATLLQTHMWTKDVTTANIYPFGSRGPDGKIHFTVSGSLPLASIKKSFMDSFMEEFISTCMFTMGCYYELGPEGPDVDSNSQVDWIKKLAQEESKGPRKSEFDLFSNQEGEPPSDNQGE
jgi:hypothetical protein